MYELMRMPFGLVNVAQTLQNLISEVLSPLPAAFGYIGDNLLALSPPTGQTTRPQQLFESFTPLSVQNNQHYPLEAKPNKLLADEVQSVVLFPAPQTTTQSGGSLAFSLTFGFSVLAGQP